MMNCSFAGPERSIGKIIGGLVLLSCFSAGVLNAQETKLPSAKSILAKHVKAIGGKEALMKIKSRKMNGTLEVDMAGQQLKARVEVRALAPNKRHTVIQSDMLNMVRVTDGKNAWEWRGGQAADDQTEEEVAENTTLLKGSAKDVAIEQGMFYESLQSEKVYKSMKTKALTKVNDKPAYQVEVTTRSGETFSRFYDKESGRLVKAIRKIENPQAGKINIQLYLKDYRKFDGVWIATRIEQVLENPNFGKGSQVWTYTSIKNNAKVAESLFKLPKHLEKGTSEEK